MAEVEYAQQYKGQNVVAVRDACATDPGYEKDGGQQVCTLADGTTVTVKKDQLTTNAPTAQSGAQSGVKPTSRRE